VASKLLQSREQLVALLQLITASKSVSKISQVYLHAENVLENVLQVQNFMLSLQATKGSTFYIEKRVPTALLCSGQQVSHSYK
jgi:hypothetical protein